MKELGEEAARGLGAAARAAHSARVTTEVRFFAIVIEKAIESALRYNNFDRRDENNLFPQ